MDVQPEGVELRVIRMPLVEAFRTSHGHRDHREVVVVRAVVADGPDGWAECVAEVEPTYWPEYTAGALHVLEHHLVPRALAGAPLHEVRGHNMAKAALEGALLDAWLRAERRSMADYLGADVTTSEVRTGIALGITDTVDELVAAAVGWCEKGHRALKLKIAPGWDIEPVRAVRAAVGPGVDLLVDANGSYRSDFPGHVKALESLMSRQLRLAAIEQPFPPDDLLGHIALAVVAEVPVCLDESIGSLGDLDTAIALRSLCDANLAVNLKVGRVGGLLEAHRIYLRCVDEGLPVRAGGMLETGLGRALNIAVAALPGCTLPPDLGPSSRYFTRDITPPFLDRDGTLSVPAGPGLGVEPIQEVLDAVTEKQIFLRASQ